MDAAKALLVLSGDLESEPDQVKAANSQQTSGTNHPTVQENVLPDAELISEPSKEQDVQTDITMEHLKIYSTESLSSVTEMKKTLFMENVAKDAKHYTGNSFFYAHQYIYIYKTYLIYIIRHILTENKYFLGLSSECIRMLYEFVKGKAARLIKWKEKRKQANLKVTYAKSR